MDGILTRVVDAKHEIEGPDPYCTTDMDALRAVSAKHARQMAQDAGDIAAACATHPSILARTAADAAARAAELYYRHQDQRRAFQADRLRGLRDAGRLTPMQYRAAVEIGDLIQWIEAGKQVMARSQFSERLAASTSTIALHQSLEEAERLRYGPWRVWASAFPVKPDRSIEHLVRAFVAQGMGVEQVRITFRMRRERAAGLLVRALARYAAIARWEGGAIPA